MVASMAITPNHWVEKDALEESIHCRASHPKRYAFQKWLFSTKVRHPTANWRVNAVEVLSS
jgi:hypothetical protein